ncbi:hypothetical protein [Nocardioides soli]|uniref:Uncharacterized protein n=1 Tax=Nocardioides soli TaxID=1036020 RepID=A0A7W4VSZ3_9ACTN|nr:hypothetical protein [Nocardioides soli]MBB3041154.1 hypothetical protein [Nocardioides soli]
MVALGTRELELSIGGEDVTAQITNCEILSNPAESEQTTFAEAKTGGPRRYSLKGVLLQDTSDGSLWDQIWSAAGTTVAVLLKPYGGAATADKKHYSGNVVIKDPDGTLLGGDADASTTGRWTVEIEWDFTAKPTAVTGP